MGSCDVTALVMPHLLSTRTGAASCCSRDPGAGCPGASLQDAGVPAPDFLLLRSAGREKPRAAGHLEGNSELQLTEFDLNPSFFPSIPFSEGSNPFRKGRIPFLEGRNPVFMGSFTVPEGSSSFPNPSKPIWNRSIPF